MVCFTCTHPRAVVAVESIMTVREFLIFLSVMSVVSSFKVKWQTVRGEPYHLNPFLARIGPSPNFVHYKVARNIEQEELILLKRRQLECVAEVRVDPDLVLKLKQGQWQTNPHPLLKDWVLCAFMKAGLMTREGVYRIDVALSKVPFLDLNKVERHIDACLSTKAIPAVDIAYNFAKCYAQSNSSYRYASII